MIGQVSLKPFQDFLLKKILLKCKVNMVKTVLLFCYNSLNNGQNLKIQNSTESVGTALSSQFDNPQVSLIRTKCWGQKGADYWKFTVFN